MLLQKKQHGLVYMDNYNCEHVFNFFRYIPPSCINGRINQYKMEIYSSKRDLTKEIIKTRPSNSGTRMEYTRRREEQKLRNLQANGTVIVRQDNTEPRKSIGLEEAIKEQESEPEVKTFPFVDKIDGSLKGKVMEANENPGYKHGARLCMMSAMIHMKALAEKRAKSIKQLRKNPTTSLDEKTMRSARGCRGDSDLEEEDELSKLRKCRYLRGGDEDKELTIEDIFG